MKQAMINYMQNPINDELYTPPEAIKPLLKHLPKPPLTIWECTDFGESLITKMLKEKGYKVISSHINTFNFLTDKPDFEFDMIITNPPYSLKDEFLAKCYSYNKPFAMLLPLTSLEGVKRNLLFSKYGIDLIVLNKRINFMKNKKNNWFNTSWFTYKILNKNLIFEKVEE
jgi:hypothetical protein